MLGREVALHELQEPGDFSIGVRGFRARPEDVIATVDAIAADGDRYELAILTTADSGSLLYESYWRARSALNRLGSTPYAGLDIAWDARPFAFFDAHLAVYVALQRLGILHPRLATATPDHVRLAEFVRDPWREFASVFTAAWPGTAWDLSHTHDD